MAWSTRQLAELAGTTVKAVRHYHKLGLLDEPVRMSNGYKQYQVTHLIGLLQVTRLAELGVPLAQIADMERPDQDPDAALRVLDAKLKDTVERLQRIRGELAAILHHRAPADLPAGFSPVAGDLTEADRSLVMVYSRVFDESAMTELKQMISDVPRTAAEIEIDALAPDADRATRRRLGEHLAPQLAKLLAEYPWLSDPGSHAPRGAAFAQGTVVEALRELYNPAQLEVLHRAHLIATGATGALEALEAALDEGSAAKRALPDERIT